MPEQLQKIIQPIKSRWDALARDQKIKLVAAIAVVLIAIGLALYFLLRTEYEVLVNDMDILRIADLEAAIEAEGIKVDRRDDGTSLYVDKSRMEDARVIAVSSDSVPNGFTFADAISNADWSTTESSQRRMYLAAEQTRLAEGLKHFEGIRSAIVYLNIPEEKRVFSQDYEVSQAAVQLEVTSPRTTEQGHNMAMFIAAAVKGLDLKNITITDQNFNVLYSGSQEEAAKTLQGSVEEVKKVENAAVINNLTRALAQRSMFDDAVIIPNLEYDEVALKEKVEDRYEIPQNAEGGLPVNRVEEELAGENFSPDNAPGTDTNNAEQQTYNIHGYPARIC